MTEVPEEVRWFINRYIDSVERLEVLLLLQQNPEREWTGSAVAAELRIPSSAADKHLAKLCSYNILNVRIGNDLFYWFNPRPPHVEQGAQALAAAFAERRLAVLKLILERPAESIRDFAEAFRLSRKDDSDG